MTRKTTSPRGLSALVLDADAVSLRAVSRALEARSFSVLAAPDGAMGLDLLLDALLSLDAVVIDAALPHRDARAFATLIRRAGGEQDLAIVVVGAGAPELRADLLALGVDAVVERTAGADAVAAKVAVAVAARAPLGTDPEPPAAPAEPQAERPAAAARFALPLGPGWSLLPA